ncbi:cyclic di-AMP binding protein CbpA [Rummeliibacillus sp. JY-2-4R]
MIVKQRYVSKRNVIFCKETDTISSVLTKLNESGYRCIPILDHLGEKFIGNAYKVDILEYLMENEKLDTEGLISTLAKDKNGLIKEESSFYEVFLSIQWLPYIAVINEKGRFTGILTHSKVFQLLEEAWGYKTGSCALTIALPDEEGILVRTLSLIRKKSPVHCVFSIDDHDWYLRRVIVTLKKGATNNTVKEIEQLLYKVGARLIDVEVFNEDEYYKS